jgi:hypothetical protein
VSDIRDRILFQADLVKGLRAAIPELRVDFRDLLGPPPKGASWDLSVPFSCKRVGDRYFTAGVSTCGLVAAGILRRAGFRLPWSGYPYWQAPAPYHGLDIVSCLTQLGAVTEARRPAGERPEPGDVVCIGSGLATHVLTVTGWEGDVMVSVDGGQVDDAAHGWLQRVKVCRRKWGVPRIVWVLNSVELYAALEAQAVYP